MKRLLLIVLLLLVGCNQQSSSVPQPTNSIELMLIEVNPPRALAIVPITGERMTMCVADLDDGNVEVDVYIEIASATTYTPNGPSLCSVIDLTEMGADVELMLSDMLAATKEEANAGQQVTVTINSDDTRLTALSETYIGS